MQPLSFQSWYSVCSFTSLKWQMSSHVLASSPPLYKPLPTPVRKSTLHIPPTPKVLTDQYKNHGFNPWHSTGFSFAIYLRPRKRLPLGRTRHLVAESKVRVGICGLYSDIAWRIDQNLVKCFVYLTTAQKEAGLASFTTWLGTFLPLGHVPPKQKKKSFSGLSPSLNLRLKLSMNSIILDKNSPWTPSNIKWVIFLKTTPISCFNEMVFILRANLSDNLLWLTRMRVTRPLIGGLRSYIARRTFGGSLVIWANALYLTCLGSCPDINNRVTFITTSVRQTRSHWQFNLPCN